VDGKFDQTTCTKTPVNVWKELICC